MFDLQCSVHSTTLHNGNMDLVSFETVVKKIISYVLLLLRAKYDLKLYSLFRNQSSYLRTNTNLRIFIGKMLLYIFQIVCYVKILYICNAVIYPQRYKKKNDSATFFMSNFHTQCHLMAPTDTMRNRRHKNLAFEYKIEIVHLYISMLDRVFRSV